MSAPAAPVARPGVALAAAAMVGSAACWGGATVMTKGALDAIPPFTLLVLQLSASVTFLGLAVLALGQRPRPSRRTVKAALSGLLEPGLAYGVGVPGLMLTSAASASIIGAAEPVFICLLAWLLLRERPSLQLTTALAAALIGVLLVTLAGGDGGPRHLAGDALILLGTMFAALYVVLSSHFVADLPPLSLAALQQTAGLGLALVLLAGALLLGLESLPEQVGLGTLLLGLASGVVQYALAFWLYLLGLQRLPASTAGVFLALIPVFGVGSAVAFLDEQPTAAQLLGCFIVIGAVVTIARRT